MHGEKDIPPKMIFLQDTLILFFTIIINRPLNNVFGISQIPKRGSHIDLTNLASFIQCYFFILQCHRSINVHLGKQAILVNSMIGFGFTCRRLLALFWLSYDPVIMQTNALIFLIFIFIIIYTNATYVA
jgi:hypothetical protein